MESSLLHNKVGGSAWSLDFGGWSKHLDGASSNPSSKRGSRISSAPGSRKDSIIGTDTKALTIRPGRGHETAQQIWATTHDTGGRLAPGGPAATHRAHDKEAAEANTAKRLSLTKPYLKAHASEAKFGISHSKPIGHATAPPTVAAATPPVHSAPNRNKRASMPPIQNKRGLIAGTIGGGSRRGSTSQNAQALHPTHAPTRREEPYRSRSQSLPSDSLFLAYSSCALPAVMTSSLAAMPIPSQPAIPVSVARRYSVLSLADPNAPPFHQPQPPPEQALEEAVHVDPTRIEGIDTYSVLDTSHLRDMATDDVDSDEEADGIGREVGPITSKPRSNTSTQVTPSASPVGFTTVNPNAFPLSAAAAAFVGSGTLDNVPAAATPAESHPIAHSTARTGSTRSARESAVRAKLRQSLTLPTPSSHTAATISPSPHEYTPQTSPTNLGAAVFKQTLITRRMSEVVAKDLTQKLRTLKKHMQEDAEATTGETTGQ